MKKIIAASLALALIIPTGTSAFSGEGYQRPAPEPAIPPQVTVGPGGSATINMKAAGVCLPASMAQDRDIVILTMQQSNGPEVPFSIGNNSQPTRLTTVSGDVGRDTVLVLSSYGPTLWDLRGIKAGRVKAILAHGQSDQAIVGASPDTEIEFKSGQGGRGGEDSCPRIGPSAGLPGLREVAKNTYKRFTRMPTRLYAGQSVTAFDIDGGIAKAPESVNIKPEEVRAETPVTPGGIIPGMGGIKQLIERGDMRSFEPADVARWKAAGAKLAMQNDTETQRLRQSMQQRMANLPPQVRQQQEAMLLERTRQQENPTAGVVLLKNIESLPKSVQFNPNFALIVPEGVTPPSLANQYGNMPYYTLSGVPAEQLAALPARLPALFEQMERVRQNNGDSGLITLTAEWEGDAMIVRFPNDKEMPSTTAALESAADKPSKERGTLGTIMAIIGGLALLGGIGAGAYLFWKRRQDGRPIGLNFAPTVAAPPLPESDEITTLLTRLEGFVRDSTLLAVISDFRHQISRLVVREDLDDDLIEECGVIVEERFSTIAKRYIKSRGGLDGDAGKELDQAFKQTLSEMAQRLTQIHEEQNTRNITAMSGGKPEAPAS